MSKLKNNAGKEMNSVTNSFPPYNPEKYRYGIAEYLLEKLQHNSSYGTTSQGRNVYSNPDSSDGLSKLHKNEFSTKSEKVGWKNISIPETSKINGYISKSTSVTQNSCNVSVLTVDNEKNKPCCSLKEPVIKKSNNRTLNQLRKKFVCKQCQYATNRSYHLKTHIRTHTGEKPYSCTFETCLKKFSRFDVFNRHMRIHTGEKLHFCVTCSKSFYRKDHLTNHLRTHWIKS